MAEKDKAVYISHLEIPVGEILRGRSPSEMYVGFNFHPSDRLVQDLRETGFMRREKALQMNGCGAATISFIEHPHVSDSTQEKLLDVLRKHLPHCDFGSPTGPTIDSVQDFDREMARSIRGERMILASYVERDIDPGRNRQFISFFDGPSAHINEMLTTCSFTKGPARNGFASTWSIEDSPQARIICEAIQEKVAKELPDIIKPFSEICVSPGSRRSL